MKKYFTKSLAVFMAMLMLISVVGVSAVAATSYTFNFSAGSYGKETDLTFSITAEMGTSFNLPEATYTRDGYVQTGWTTSRSGSGSTTSTSYLGDVGELYTVTKRVANVYPYWSIISFDVTFAPGADGTGVPVVKEVDYNKTTSFPGAVFTRDGYVQIGWTSVEGGESEYGLTGTTPKVTEDLTFYPVWQKCDYTVEANLSKVNFGNVCEDYSAPAAESLTITNLGNMTLNYKLPTNPAYTYVVKSGSLALAAGKSVTIEIKPVAGLAVADYSANLVFDCDADVSDVIVAVTFKVNDHSFDKYISNNDATYEADGTKSAECSNGCGAFDTIVDEGSMKVYSADNNTVDGLLEEYLYHKTIRVTVYGSGTDNVQADGSIAQGTKRYRPVSWYVNDEFNGEFKDDYYDINFVHTSFGDYSLTIKYVEEVYVCDNHTGPYYFCEECGELTKEKCEYCGLDTLALVCDICNDPTCGNVIFEDESEKTFGWVATGEEDEKSFDYYVGPSEKEEQEIVRPNTIVSIIFALFAYIAELFSGLFG